MLDYRSLTVDEIGILEHQGCTAEEWGNIRVAEDFSPEFVHNVAFYGEVCMGVFDKKIETAEGFFRHSGIRNATLCDVIIGDNCLIENVSGHICRYIIGDECYIAGVGTMTTTEGATYGQGNAVAVLNEAGDGNVIIYDRLTSQMADFMVRHAGDATVWEPLCEAVKRHIDTNRPEQGTIGNCVKIVNTQEIINTIVSDECEINGALRLHDCTLCGSPEAGVYVGNGVISENTVMQAGASVLNGAQTYNCLVGEACHVGKGFSAENCVFFANSYMDNGEACAAFCGPFTVSHHKSTLLIGGRYSFYNAGSNTNYSNHAYKLGPIHYGTLERGVKTASGAHLLMPAEVGAFSMCMGKIQNHPDTGDLPFSYLIASGDTTYIVPGRNISTVGTYRDINKWPKRDMRPHGCRSSIVNFDWLSPYTVQRIIRGRQLLEALRREQGDSVAAYNYGGCLINNRSLINGLRLYDMAIRMYMGMVVEHHDNELPAGTIGTGEWLDLAGLLVPEAEVNLLADDIRSGNLDIVELIEERFTTMHENYDDYLWNWAYGTIVDYLGVDSLTNDDIERIKADASAAHHEWLTAIRYDAEKEHALGDVDDDTLNGFIAKLEC